MKVRIRVLPAGKELDLKKGLNLREALIEAGVFVDSPCSGQGTCLKCKVQVSGISQKPTELEREKLAAEELRRGWRLACQVTLEMPGEIQLPETEGLQAKASFGLLGEEIPRQPNVRRRHFELSEPTTADQRADWDRLAGYLEAAESTPVTADLSLLQDLPDRLREWNFQGEAILVGEAAVALDPPGPTRGALGLALDIGTTTLAAGLADLDTGRILVLDAELNPQTSCGADVIARIAYMQGDPEKRKRMQKELVKGLNRLLLRLCRNTGRDKERIFEVTVVGNTTMLHSLIGLDTSHIAVMPYAGASSQALVVPAGDLELQIHPRGQVYILPTIASFVGADTVAVILATKLHQATVPTLAIDIGTNGEVVLATGDGVVAASTAAGPAFEGGQITFGMRAATGAISSFQATPSLSYNVIGDSRPRGICGSGLIDLAAELFKAGVVDQTGRMLSDSQFNSDLPADLAARVRVRGDEIRFVIFEKEETEISLTQQDIRQIQLAKGAIRTGIELLVKEANIKAEDIQEVLLSGVFGNYINREKALILGLIPPFPLPRIRFIGNGALDGALRALLNVEERQQAEEISRQARHIELSGRADFEETFVRCLKLGVEIH